MTLTLAEADAVIDLPADAEAAVRALAKVRAAVAPLRALNWLTDPKLRMAKAARPSLPKVSIDTSAAPAPELDDYVPWRDEANGIYK